MRGKCYREERFGVGAQNVRKETSMNNLRKLALGLAAVGAFASFAALAGAQDEPYQHVPLPSQLPKGVSVEEAKRLQGLIDDYKRQEPLMVTKLKDNVYLAKGGRGGNDGNVGFAVGKTGVIIVDTKNSAASEKDVIDEIAKITPLPVDTAFIDHSDNEGGITAFPAGKLTIIAQENTKTEMQESKARNAVPPEYYPTKTIAKDETMNIDGVKVRALHWAPAHTSGDLVVYFPAQKVVFCEDLIVTDFPLAGTQIHPNLHGSVAGWIETVKGMIALNADTYVSGHGDVFTKNDVKTKLAFIQDHWDKVKSMVAQGKSLNDIKTALGESTEPPKPNAQGNLPPMTMTEIIYNEITNTEG
jgi:cyclase